MSILASLPADEEFLAVLRERTEATWADYSPRTRDAYERRGVGGTDWQRGTRWLGGMDDAAIAAAERRWDLRFPPEHRLFLQTLHAPDRPRRGYLYTEGEGLSPADRPSFYDWRAGYEGQPVPFTGLAGAFEWLYQGLFFDIEHGFWPPTWGPMPSTLEEQGVRLRELIAAAPRLVPIIDHQYLLADPARANNPVLSVWQSDTIVFAATLRSGLLRDFGYLFVSDPKARSLLREDILEEREVAPCAPIPFWGELYRWRRDRSAWHKESDLP